HYYWGAPSFDGGVSRKSDMEGALVYTAPARVWDWPTYGDALGRFHMDNPAPSWRCAGVGNGIARVFVNYALGKSSDSGAILDVERLVTCKEKPNQPPKDTRVGGVLQINLWSQTNGYAFASLYDGQKSTPEA